MDFSAAGEKLRQDGYAVIEDFLTDQEVKDLKQRMNEILDAMDPTEHQTVFSTDKPAETVTEYFFKSADRISFFFEDGALDECGNLTVEKHLSVNKIGHALHCEDPVFTRVTQSDKMKEMVKKAVQYKDPVICQSMYIFKQPKLGGVVRPHQDSTFTNTNPKKLTGIWIPLEDAEVDNSCIWVLPGSHKEGVHNNKHLIRNPDQGPDQPSVIFTADGVEYDDSLFLPVEMKAGSLLLIHGEVVHKSEPNTSARSRHAYTFHVYEGEGVEYSKENCNTAKCSVGTCSESKHRWFKARMYKLKTH